MYHEIGCCYLRVMGSPLESRPKPNLGAMASPSVVYSPALSHENVHVLGVSAYFRQSALSSFPGTNHYGAGSCLQ